MKGRASTQIDSSIGVKRYRLKRIKKDLDFLCGVECFGRLSGTEGAKKAADYISKVLQSNELTPLGKNKYLEPVEV